MAASGKGTDEEIQSDRAKLDELASIVQAVKERVRARYPQHSTPAGEGSHSQIQVPLADLLPILHARDAAQARVAAIGSVNPRPGGLANKVIQTVKRLIARSLGWFVRDQVTFNRESVAAIEAILEALNEQNRAIASLAAHISPLQGEAKELREGVKDVQKHWAEWRSGWEHKLATNEIQLLRNVAELQGAFQHRVNQLELTFLEKTKSQHADYLVALDRSTHEIQKRLWADLQKVQADYERLIHTELRLIRQRGLGQSPAPLTPPPTLQASAAQALGFDYSRFAERFRGSAAYVSQNQEFYRPFFEGRENVLDIGCGRGEFLSMMRDAGVKARGIDLGAESIEQCRAKGLEAEEADLFTYLNAQPDFEFDGIFSSQVVEHIDPALLPEMIRLCAAKLRRGGILAIETPNPECLAIFATHFFLDPTHTRPVPSPLLSFYMEEAGLGRIETHPLSPAVESMPEVAELPDGFRNRFFGGLDYAIVGQKL